MPIAEAVAFGCRCIQPFIAITTLGLCAYLLDELFMSPQPIVFLLFTSVWTLFPALPLLIFKTKLIPPYTSAKNFFLLLEFATFVFWLSGFAALVHWYHGSDFCIGKACGYVVATIFFAAFGWVLWSITATVHASKVWNARHNPSGFHNRQTETMTGHTTS